MSDAGINPYDTPEPPPVPIAEPPEPDFIEPPPLDDPEAEARRQGYSWPEIKNHVAASTTAALAAGYSAREIDDFLGYRDPANVATRAQTQWLADPAFVDSIEPVAPDLAALPTMRQDYAAALLNREVKGPRDFAASYADALRNTMDARRVGLGSEGNLALDQSAAELAASLPTNEELTDAALAIARGVGIEPDAQTVRATKENTIDYWTGLGGPSLIDVYRESNIDPLLQDALATPKPPGPATPPPMDDHPFGFEDEAEHADLAASLEDLQRPGRDRINPVSMMGEPVEHKSLLGDLEDLGLTIAGVVAGGYVIKAGGVVVGSLARSEAGQYVIKGLANLLADESGALTAPETPITQAIADDLRAAVDRLGKARRQSGPDLPVPEALGDLKPIVTRLEDDLNRLRTNATADKVVMAQAIERLPAQWLDPGLQEQISREVESRLIPPARREIVTEEAANASRTTIDINGKRVVDTTGPIPTPEAVRNAALWGRQIGARPAGEFSPEVQEVLAGVKGMTDRQAELGDMIRAKLAGVAIDDPSIAPVMRTEEGYVHRIVKGQETRGTIADPNVEQDVITGSGGQRTISKFAPGMQGRSMYVLENEQGARVFGSKPLDQINNPALTSEEVGKPFVRQTAQYGDVIEPPGGGKWTIKPATMEEVEANTDIRYHKNFLANTVENVTRLERVNRNLDFLQTTGKELETQGLFVRAPPGTVIAPKAADGMLKVDLPGMQGWAQPTIANALNDFFSASKGDLDGFLTKASRFLVGSLFVSPVVHAGNVGAHWAVGRGWDWVKPAGYGSLMRDGLDALREVWTQGPRYIEHLRQGSGLLYASTTTENFYKTLMTKLFHEQMADQNTWGQYARGLGFPALVDLVKAEYRWSRKTLWAANDVFMLQRQFELERQGRTMAEAIFQAEKDIPNYRVPTEVMGSHTMAEFLRSPLYMNFGRYKYGQVRALGLIADDLARGSMQDRLDALGKLTMLGAISLGAYPLLNSGLQKLTGDPGWSVRGFGPFSLIDSVRGFTAGQKDWLSALSSFVSIGPLIDIARRVSTNRDVWGRKIVDDKATWVGKLVQGLEATAQTFYPSQLLLQAIKDGNPNKAIAGLLGATYKKPVDAEQQAKWDKRDLGEAVSRERKDVIEQWLKEHLGITDVTTQPAPGRSSGGGRGGGSGIAAARTPAIASNPGFYGYNAPQGGYQPGVADTTGGAPVYPGGSGGAAPRIPRARIRTPRPANLLPARQRTRNRRGQ